MVATTRFQTTAALNFGSAKKAAPAQGVPLQQPLGYSRPQTATFATSGALAYGSNLIASTVRKLPVKFESINTDDVLSSFLGKREVSEGKKPVFRSALEQVSYDTNSSLSKATVPSKRPTLAGRLARMIRK
jgi:hypothetical protein